jgi:all-trans-nonaprenyl-diphosphate synthase
VIADFANGEIKQAASLFDCDLTFEDYMNKSYWKTASLIAASAKSAAIFSEVSQKDQENMFEYGRHLGLAFQVVDDILDFTQTSEQLGKPAGSDLASGNLTAPVLFALKKEPRLEELIGNEFVDEGDLEEAIALVHSGGGIEEARKLAKREGDLALQCLECLPECASKHSLQGLVSYVLDRLY